jgi:hypothetical protein
LRRVSKHLITCMEHSFASILDMAWYTLRIHGKRMKYGMVTGEEFTRAAMWRNYEAIQEKLGWCENVEA